MTGCLRNGGRDRHGRQVGRRLDGRALNLCGRGGHIRLGSGVGCLRRRNRGRG